jgi:hypothetical protein
MCSKWGIIMFYTSIHSLYLALYALHRDSKVGDGIYKVQVSTTANHVGAVTKAGRLFTWGHGWYGCLGHNMGYNELRPKRVKHGGFAELFIVCASAGHYRSAAIDSSGLVPIFCFSTILDIATLQFILYPWVVIILMWVVIILMWVVIILMDALK